MRFENHSLTVTSQNRRVRDARVSKRFRSLAVTAQTVTAVLLLASQTLLAQDTAERHEFAISNFRSESGVTLAQARVVYGTYGHLNAAKDNAVLLPSHSFRSIRSA